MQPDIVCLPETFAFRTLEEFRATGGAASFSGGLFEPLRKFSRQHKCYMICPTYTEMNGNFYNAAILMDRNGEKAGEYLKIHPAASEIDAGIRPGPLDPPVFETDFGKIGIQICYDVKWDDGWSRLKQLGAEIIFWPSAYPGGEELKSKAWLKQVHVISSTRKGISRICGMTGEVIAQTGFWQPNFACAPIHPEKAVIPTWPYVSEFPAMLKKYNKRIHVKTFDEEEWTILESLDGNLKIADIIAEFGFKTQYQALTEIEEIQKGKR
jgi:predicted amidohydrolase